MKHLVIFITNLISFLIILGSFDVYHSVVYFFIAGQIPGTNVYLDSSTMLVLCMVPIGFLFGRISAWIYTSIQNAPFVKQRA